MNIRNLLFLLAFGSRLFAQNPCNDAGTFHLENFVGQSSQHDLPTVFLCFGDQVDLAHDGNFDFSGDPNLATPAAVSYAVFDCSPTVSGPNLDAILADPCLSKWQNLSPWIFGIDHATQALGDQTLINDGSFQAFFAQNTPFSSFFAPITLDYWDATGFGFEGTPPGSCVNVRTDAAFSTVFLNEIKVSNIDSSYGGHPCIGSFRVRGGQSEFAGSTSIYSISVDGPLSVTPANPPATVFHGGIAPVFYFEEGKENYAFTITDAKSCSKTIDLKMCSDPTGGGTALKNLKIQPDSAVFQAGETRCVAV